MVVAGTTRLHGAVVRLLGGGGEEGRRGVPGHDDDEDHGLLLVERHGHAHRRRLLVAAAPRRRGGLAVDANEHEQRHGDEARLGKTSPRNKRYGVGVCHTLGRLPTPLSIRPKSL
jgi:hypothetical protein